MAPPRRIAPEALALPLGVGLACALSGAALAGPTTPHQPNESCQPAWQAAFGPAPGLDGSVGEMVVFDDGTGPALYAGGGFQWANGVEVDGLARWDGSTWQRVPHTGYTFLECLAVFDDGSGPALYTGGVINTPAGGNPVRTVQRWDGSQWTQLGGTFDLLVNDLIVFDDGTGPALYVGGSFNNIGGQPIEGVARWSGTDWTAVGSLSFFNVDDMAVHDDGTGPALYATTTNLGIVRRWNGSSWVAVGSGFGGSLFALESYGGKLYAGGFVPSGAGYLRAWDGTSWSNVGGPAPNASVSDLLSVVGPGGSSLLIVGGGFTQIAGTAASRIAVWNGEVWSTLGAGTDQGVGALEVFDDGGGPGLFAAGGFQQAGAVPATGIAQWRNSAWSALGSTAGLSDSPVDLAEYDDGTGPALYAGGTMKSIGGTFVNRVGRWDGSSWSSLGAGIQGLWVIALDVFDDGSESGPRLIAGGNFTQAGSAPANNIASWDGTSWSALGAGVDDQVEALATHDDGSGPALYAGGWFFNAGGSLSPFISRWDGTDWGSVGGGMNDLVIALESHDDGSGGGEQLYAGGLFTNAGGVPAAFIARWDGTSWSDLGGADGFIYELKSVDDPFGQGPTLYAGGPFTTIGGQPANGIARWDGTSWHALGAGVGPSFSQVRTVEFYDDGTGSGPALFAGGFFTTAGGVSANYVARWDGTTWTPLGAGLSDWIRTLQVHDDGSGSSLYAGGFFLESPAGDSYLARWTGCASSGQTYCTAGFSASGCQASLTSSGLASATAISGFDLSASGVEGGKDGLFFFGTNGRQANPWGSGTSYQCVVPPVLRAGLLAGSGTSGFCDGAFTQDLNALWCAGCPKPLKNPGSGATVQAQLWYRDPLNTSNQTTSLSDAIEFLVAP